MSYIKNMGRSHSIPCRNFDRNTVLCKMCSDTTRAITNTNLVIDARYCPAPADTPKQYWKVSLYFAFIDHMIMELESRLIKSENRFYAQYLLPRVIGNITNEQIATLYETYQIHFKLIHRVVQLVTTQWQLYILLLPPAGHIRYLAGISTETPYSVKCVLILPDALYTFKTSFPIVVHALERLQGLGDDKAGQYLASITRFVFVIALVVSAHISTTKLCFPLFF
jgi:hypothetical protein